MFGADASSVSATLFFLGFGRVRLMSRRVGSRWLSLSRATWLVAALLLVAWVAPKVIPKQMLVRRLTAAVEGVTGRKLEIGGKVSIWLLPTPGASAERVTLANADWAGSEPMVSVRRAEVWLALLPLLTGRVVFDEIDLEGPVVNLNAGPDGRGNWILRPRVSAAPARPAAPRMIATEESAVGLFASRTSSTVAPPALQSPAVPAPPMRRAVLPRSPAVRSIYVTGGRVTYRDRAEVSYIFDDVWITVTGGAFEMNPLDVRVATKWSGEWVTARVIIFNSNAFLEGAGSPVRARSRVGDSGIDVEGTGGLWPKPHGDAEVSLRLVPRSTQLAKLMRWLGDLTLQSHLTLADRHVSLEGLQIRHEEPKIEVKADIAVDATQTRPRIVGKLLFDRVDFDRLLPPRALANPDGQAVESDVAETAPNPPREWSVAPLKLALLDHVDADITLSGGPLILRQIDIGPIGLRLWFNDGHAVAELSDTRVGDGVLAMRLQIDRLLPEGAAVRLEVNGSQVPTDLLPIGRDMVTGGVVALHANLSSHGTNPRTLIGNLEGDLHITTEGTLLQLGQLLRKIRGLHSTCAATVDQLTASADADVTAGVVRIAVLDLRSPALQLAGNGEVNLPDRSLTLSLHSRPGSCLVETAIRGKWNDLTQRAAGP